MRTQLLGVLIYGFLVVTSGEGAWAAHPDSSPVRVQTISNANPEAIHMRSPGLERRSEKSSPSFSLQRAKKPALSVKDLLFTKPQSSTHKTVDTISVEPWVPGRGSLGVKLEVTW